MPYSYPEMKTFAGLFLQANSFTLPDGAMEIAENIVLKSDNVISKIRGNYLYYDATVTLLNQLFFYKGKLLAAFATKISYFTDTGSVPNQTGSITNLSGEAVVITAPRVSRSVEASNNFYFTTDNGVLKLEDYNSKVYQSGVPQALDLSLLILNSSIGPIDANKYVSYRVIFGRRDSNNNLLLSAPSNIGTIHVPNGGTGVAYTSTGSGPYTVTVTSPNHGLMNGNEIVVSGATDSDANGVQIITVTSTNAFTYSTVSDPASGTLNYTFSRQIRIEASIPSQISDATDNWFIQVYRSSQSDTDPPPLDFKLVSEQTLTSADITARVVFFNDDVDDILLGAELYTNPNSREGELQANFRAPKCQDMTFYKNYVFYANCESRKIINLDVVDTSVLSGTSFIEIRSGNITRRYTAKVGVANTTVTSQSISNAAGSLQINYVAHGFNNGDTVYVSNVVGGTLVAGTYFVVNKATDNFQISLTFGGSAVAYNSETALDFQGVTSPASVSAVSWIRTTSVVTVTSVAHGLSSGLTIAVTASSGGSPNVTLTNYIITVTGVNTFTFVNVGANSSGTLDYRLTTYMFKLDNTSNSISVELRTTSQGIVKAVNRDADSLVYANYVSTSVPGQMRFMAKGFIDTIYIRASSDSEGQGFLPVLPGSFTTGTQVFSINDDQRNVFYTSKLSEPEAVPLINFFSVGSRTKVILRIVALRDSVIIIKEDGLFRLTGDSPDNFVITVLDSTVICVATSSVKLLNNEVIFLSNQGICRVSENSVQIVSRRIDDVIQPILGKSVLETETSAISYESERLYFLTTTSTNSDVADVTYIYNVLNGSWTSSTPLISQGIIGPSDTMYFINEDNEIKRERKSQTKIDFSDQNFATTVTSVASDKLSAIVNIPGAVPEEGDMLVLNNAITRINSVTNLGSSNFNLTFPKQTNITAASTPILYEKIISRIKMAPFHAGEIGRMKQFAQLQVHTRQESISKITISFTGYLFGGSETVEWSIDSVYGTATGGWGFEPWGFFLWGLEEEIQNTAGTLPASPIRIYVPRFQQRTTFIQLVLMHEEAGEGINIQALAYTVRAYYERVAK